MSRLLLVPAFTAAAVAAGLAFAAPPSTHPPDVQRMVDIGRAIFETSCASSFCHGSGAAGGQGPGLIDRPLDPERVRQTILNGRTGTPMPPFKDTLDPAMFNNVVAFVLSVSSGGKLPVSAAGATQAAAPMPPSPPSKDPVAIGREKGTPSSGAALFFDATRITTCRTCHSFQKRGAAIGPDLAELKQPPAAILARLTEAKLAPAAWPAVRVTLTDGTVLTGIRRDESETVLRLYDVATPLPVSRALPKAAVAKTEPVAGGLVDHTKLGLSRQQLLDLAAFLGTAK
jgi:putative heme-binding domain-containing protein